jgi:serine/threonine-protein kinase
MSVGAPVSEGEVLAGKYRVERVLGEGGMGIVVAAQHVQLGQRVAIKFLLPQACLMPEAVERFIREARASVQIRSEHVARVSDVGTLETGSPYMVMEYLQGSDLSAVLRSRHRLQPLEATDYLLQACEAIAEAHSLGIVHRDLKPANLFLTRRADGSSLVKVLDFGISKINPVGGGASSGGVTATTAVMGSPLYMSPEQVRSSKSVDARTDVWSLGVILHELLTGRTAFEADTLPAVLAAVVADAPAPLRAHLPDAPVELERVIQRCLEKDLTQRYQSVADLANALLPFAPPSARVSVERIARLVSSSGTNLLGSAPPPALGGGSGDPRVASHGLPINTPLPQYGRTPSPITSGGWGSTGPNIRRGPPVAAIVLAVVTVVAAVAGGGWLAVRRHASGPPSIEAGLGATAATIAPPGVTSAASTPAPPLSAPLPQPSLPNLPPDVLAPSSPADADTVSSVRNKSLNPPKVVVQPRIPTPAIPQNKTPPPSTGAHPSSTTGGQPNANSAFDDRK